MSQDYSELGYDAGNLKQASMGEGQNYMSPLDADASFGDGSFPGIKLSSGPNIMAYGFADNFDSSYPFILPYYIDSSSRVVRATLSLFFQPYRAYETAASSGGGSTSGSGGGTTQSSTSGGGQTTSSGGGQTSSSSGSSHTHTVDNHTHGVGIPVDGAARAANLTYNPAATNNGLGGSGGANATITGVTSDNGGGQTSSAASAGHDHTVSDHTHTVSDHTHSVTFPDHTHSTPNHTHGITYGIYSSGYPTNVSITIDGTDVTSALGGPWNPSVGDPNELDMDITNYTSKTGSHVIQLTTSGQGRCIPLLIIKSVIGSKS